MLFILSGFRQSRCFCTKHFSSDFLFLNYFEVSTSANQPHLPTMLDYPVILRTELKLSWLVALARRISNCLPCKNICFLTLLRGGGSVQECLFPNSVNRRGGGREGYSWSYNKCAAVKFIFDITTRQRTRQRGLMSRRHFLHQVGVY